MARFSLPTTKRALRRAKLRWYGLRQKVLDAVFTTLYGMPMQVLPRGHAGLAAALVLWVIQDGQRLAVMVRNPKAKDMRARLVSCIGLGNSSDMSAALRGAMESQLGKVFARTLDRKLLNPDRVAAAPLFTYLDEETGISSPVQVLAWVVQIQPVQLELIQPGQGLELMMVPEATLDAAPAVAGHISPTHRAIWHSAHRHMPSMKVSKGRGDGVEEVSMEHGELKKKSGARTVH